MSNHSNIRELYRCMGTNVVEYEFDDDSVEDWRKTMDEQGFSRDDVLDQQNRDLARRFVPSAMSSAIKSICGPSGPDIVIIYGLPLSEQDTGFFSSTPPGLLPEDAIAELALCGVASAGGLKAFSYDQEKDGDIPANIWPVAVGKNVQSSDGNGDLAWHGDGGVLSWPLRPPVLMLATRYNPSNTGTRIASIDAAVSRLDDDSIEILEQPRFRHHAPTTFNLFGGRLIGSPPSPVLERDNFERRIVTLSSSNTHADTPEAERALQALHDAADDVSVTIPTDPGTVVAFSNLRCLHARPLFAGTRLLQRLYAAPSLQALKAASIEVRPNVFAVEQLVLQ